MHVFGHIFLLAPHFLVGFPLFVLNMYVMEVMLLKKDNQLSFVTYEASLKLSSSDPVKLIFDAIDWSFIYPLVEDKYSNTGRAGFDPVSMFKAQLLIYLGEVKSDRSLASSLSFNARHCLLCGFNNFLDTPTHGAFSQFRKRLGEETFYKILRKIIAQAIVLNVIGGESAAVDSTHISAYSNSSGKRTCNCRGKCEHKRVYSDPDARTGAKSENHYFFGYKVHMVVDRKSGLPIDVIVTSGEVGDSPYLKPLIERAKENHPDLEIKNISADAAYDSYENYHFLIKDSKMTPFIALNPRGSDKSFPLGELSLTSDGKYLCIAGHQLVSRGRDRSMSNRLKLRCPAAMGRVNCLFRDVCSSSSYGKIFYVYPDKELRLIGPVPRGTNEWKLNYNNRTAAERANSELKGEHKLDNLRVRGLKNVTIHACLSIVAQVLKRTARVSKERVPLECAAAA
jgi:transposase